MTTRRSFLEVIGGGLGLTALGTAPTRPRPARRAPFGLQLYSVRRELQKDVAGTLAKVKAIGFTDVETAGFHGLTAQVFAAELRKAGLICRSGLFDFDRFRDDPAGVVRDGQTLGAKFVGCAWIPHQGPFTREDCLHAAEVFTKAARVAHESGLRFAYHLHGYEWMPSTEGTLFDTLVAQTPADLVNFEVDVLWAKAGGADPAALIEKLGKRVPLTHLKDMAKGTQYTPPTTEIPESANVVLGTGMLDIPAILRASDRAGVEYHFLEDEHVDALEHLPKSLAYLRGLAPANERAS
jgi:sugar phosphate isomerase/epimerase